MKRIFWISLYAMFALSVLTRCSNTPATQAYASPSAQTAPNRLSPTAQLVPNPKGYYEIGSPTYSEIFVAPGGNDAPENPGTDRGSPLRTLSEAWQRLPPAPLTQAVRINLLPGSYPCEPGPEENNCINYFSERSGSQQFPIVIRASDGPGTVTLRGGLNLNQIAYVYLLDLNLTGGGNLPTNSSGNNLLHIEQGDHILLRGLVVQGPNCPTDACNNLQEVLKVNQTQNLYVESSRFSGAWHSSVDYFVVQSGHFLNNKIHTAGQWCMYVKGGSAYLRIEGNVLYDCQLGFQSGQSANLAVMRPPWFHFETYDIKFVNNVLHDIPGVGLSAAGAYNTLFAHNTLVRVGISQDPGYPVLQFVPGERNCTPIDEIPNVIQNCATYAAQGAWGPTTLTEGLPAIPNRGIYVFNNLIYNPAPSQTLYSHFMVSGPISRPAGFANLPAQIILDENVVMQGNLIWNGPADHPFGIEDTSQGCQPANPTCNLTLITSQNTINQIEPQLVDVVNGNFRPLPGGNVLNTAARPVPDFQWASFTPAVPPGDLNNTISFDREHKPRTSSSPPGAYAARSGSWFYLPFLVR